MNTYSEGFFITNTLYFLMDLKILGISDTEFEILRLLFRKRHRFVSLREIECELFLRQPVVSLLTKKMREAGWVDQKEVRRKDRGRPQVMIKWNGKAKDHLLNLVRSKISEMKELEEYIAETFTPK